MWVSNTMNKSKGKYLLDERVYILGEAENIGENVVCCKYLNFSFFSEEIFLIFP